MGLTHAFHIRSNVLPLGSDLPRAAINLASQNVAVVFCGNTRPTCYEGGVPRRKKRTEVSDSMFEVEHIRNYNTFRLQQFVDIRDPESTIVAI